jgi:hypothetical protein
LRDEYPQQVQSTIRLILGIHALAESRLSAALAWLEMPIYRWQEDRPGDESLRAALRAVALQRSHNSGAVNEIAESVISFNSRRERTDDLVVTGDLAKRLARLIAVSSAYVASRRFTGLDVGSSADLPTILRQIYGEHWVQIVRFVERYGFYAFDEAYRGFSPGEQAELENNLAEMLRQIKASSDSIGPICQPILFPDGSTYRGLDGVGLAAQGWAECKDCEKPRRLLELLREMWSLCQVRNR